MTAGPRDDSSTHRLVSSFLSFLFWFLGFPKTMIYRFTKKNKKQKTNLHAEPRWEEKKAHPLPIHSL